jgi:hypothetical protein
VPRWKDSNLHYQLRRLADCPLSYNENNCHDNQEGNKQTSCQAEDCQCEHGTSPGGRTLIPPIKSRVLCL